jgi:hypothetical protein
MYTPVSLFSLSFEASLNSVAYPSVYKPPQPPSLGSMLKFPILPSVAVTVPVIFSPSSFAVRISIVS